MKRRVFSMLLATAMAVTLMSGCGQKEETHEADNSTQSTESEEQESSDAGEETAEGTAGDFLYRVGFSNLADSDENCNMAASTFKAIVESEEFEKAVGHKVTVEWTDSNKDITKQTANVETLIAKGIDVIFIIGVDTAGNSSAVEACNKAGIPVFMVATESESGEFKFVGFNEYDCGKVQGEYVEENAESGDKICYIEGTTGQESSVLRAEGFYAGLEGRDDIEILSTQSGDYSAEVAMQVTEDWIQVYGDEIDWIVTQDNQMAQGVIEVLQAGNMLDKIRISGWIVPGTWDAEYLRNGDMEHAVHVSFKTLGETAAEVCRKLYIGENIEEETYMDLYSITEDNFSEFFD